MREVHVACPRCAEQGRTSLLDVRYDWIELAVPKSLDFFEHRWATRGDGRLGPLDFSGVWRFRELMPFYSSEERIVTIGEGRTILQQADLLAEQIGMPPGRPVACSTRG